MNPLAAEEHAREKERLEELSIQREDLERSLAELEALRDELAETVERRFEETLGEVERHFEEVAATLFPGGRGRLLRVEDEEGGEAGIELELQPAGKRVTRLSLLSGGEKALGAISFLFALFLARPCPFYLLDEVEAALDDANIGRFIGAPAALRRPGAVHRRHTPEEDDRGRRYPLRRDHGRRRDLADRLQAAGGGVGSRGPQRVTETSPEPNESVAVWPRRAARGGVLGGAHSSLGVNAACVLASNHPAHPVGEPSLGS